MHTGPTLLHAYAISWRSESWRSSPALTHADSGHTLNYEALFARVSSMAGGLRQAGVAPRTLVAVAMERSIESVIAILGIMAAGACPCPLEPRLTSQEIESRLRTVGIQTVLADAPGLATLEALSKTRVLQAETLVNAEAFWADDIQPHDPGLLLFTSGSTGRPKGVLLSHRGLLNNARGVIPATGLDATHKLLHIMPLYHTNGLNNQLFSPLLARSQIVLGPRFRASDMPALLEQHRPTIITGVPTMYSRMLDQSFTPESLAALRFARCGSAPITQELHKRIEAHLQCPLVISYGLSEATCTSTINPPHMRKLGSIGKALPNQDIHLRASDGSVITEAGIEGEICIGGDSLMMGYLGTSADGILEPAASVIHSGDLGHVDEDDYFYITGRLKDVIIRGGENISPAIIEHVISTLPWVRACCVVGRPDADLGEVPVAFVVPADPALKDKPAIEILIKEQLSRIYQPEEIYFIDSLPENSVGKVDRKALALNLATSAPG